MNSPYPLAQLKEQLKLPTARPLLLDNKYSLTREPLLLIYLLMDEDKRQQFRRAAKNLHNLRTKYPMAFTDWDEAGENPTTTQ